MDSSPLPVPDLPAGGEDGGGRRDLVSLLFSLRVPVSRRAYAVTGFSLMALKYAVDAGVIQYFSGKFLTPLDYLSPLLSLREKFFIRGPEWLPWLLVIWTLPFMWIGVSMSVRRAMDAGGAGWTGLLFLVPGVNYIAMLVLCCLPTAVRDSRIAGHAEPALDLRLTSALLGVAASVAIALANVGVAVYLVGEYGSALFIGTPVIMGAVTAYLFNHGHPAGVGATLGVASLGIVLTGGALLLFALEGLLCVAMAVPVAIPMAMIGALAGRAIALHPLSPMSSVPIVLVALPVLTGAGALFRRPALYEVVSSVEIEAPPEKVWPNVIGFTDLPEPEEWFFRLGIAYPRRARLEGTGVGAVRRCEFSTGAFVEPITRWEEGRSLSFDVVSQPLPMHEWSPYRHVHPPHLDGYLRSRRGEFRLVSLPGGRTRLEGSTWYELDLFPNAYWTLWSDALIHRIHERVLRHIKVRSEEGP